MYLQRFVELLNRFVNVVTLRLTDEDVTLGNLGEPARAIFFVREDGTTADDARRRNSLLSGATDHFLLVEQPCRNVVKLGRVDEVRTVNKCFTTSEHIQEYIIVTHWHSIGYQHLLRHRHGNDFSVGGGGQKLVENNQDNQIQNITLCNIYFSKKVYTVYNGV